MSKFLLNSCCIFLLSAISVAEILMVRLFLWQDKVDAALSIRDSTRILCIGNSHTGCTWEDLENEGVQVSWQSATSLPFYWVRLAEIEKRGGLKSVKVLILDCCSPAKGISEDDVVRNMVEHFPITYHYIDKLPARRIQFMKKLLCPISSTWTVSEKAPGPGRVWTDLSPKERQEEIESTYKAKRNPLPSNVDMICIDYLEHIKIICKKHGIKLLLFFAPLPSENPQRNSPELNAWKQLLKSRGYSVHDFRSDCPDKDFRDCHHLSYEGRKKFTKRHLHEIKEMCSLGVY